MNISHVVTPVVSAIEPLATFRANKRTGRDMLGINMALQKPFGCEEATAMNRALTDAKVL
jgi:hypothetical protein